MFYNEFLLFYSLWVIKHTVILIKPLFLACKSCGHVQRFSGYSAAACLPTPGTPADGAVLSGIWWGSPEVKVADLLGLPRDGC